MHGISTSLSKFILRKNILAWTMFFLIPFFNCAQFTLTVFRRTTIFWVFVFWKHLLKSQAKAKSGDIADHSGEPKMILLRLKWPFSAPLDCMRLQRLLDCSLSCFTLTTNGLNIVKVYGCDVFSVSSFSHVTLWQIRLFVGFLNYVQMNYQFNKML